MVKLRLSRTGRKGEATYRIVAIDSRRKRESKALEYVGFYLPHQKQLNLNAERIQYWLSVGAQPTETVWNMLAKQGLVDKKARTNKKYNEKPGQKSIDRKEAKATKAEEAKKAKEAPAVEVEAPAVEEAAADEQASA
jgi:small subunit ribosomal protein S16